jgi:catechol 2,3-dioxygenase-like lactoylglutathione lyase family enzyme
MAFIDHVNLRIPEQGVEEVLEFYRDLLGLESWKLEDYRENNRTSFFFKIGENALINMRPKEDFERPSGKSFDHFCIVKDLDIEELKQKAEEKGFKVLRTGEPLGTQGRAPAVYLEDPFGYRIEVKQDKK